MDIGLLMVDMLDIPFLIMGKVFGIFAMGIIGAG